MLNKKKKYVEDIITVRNFIGKIVEKIGEIEQFDAFKKEKLEKTIIKDKYFKRYIGRQIRAKDENKTLLKYLSMLEENKAKLPKISDFETEVLKTVSKTKQIEFEKIRTKIRERYYVEARQYAYYIFKIILQYSHSRTGLIFMRDHSTVIHGLESHENLMYIDSNYREDFFQCLDKLIEDFPDKFQNYTSDKLKQRYERRKK